MLIKSMNTIRTIILCFSFLQLFTCPRYPRIDPLALLEN